MTVIGPRGWPGSPARCAQHRPERSADGSGSRREAGNDAGADSATGWIERIARRRRPLVAGQADSTASVRTWCASRWWWRRRRTSVAAKRSTRISHSPTKYPSLSLLISSRGPGRASGFAEGQRAQRRCPPDLAACRPPCWVGVERRAPSRTVRSERAERRGVGSRRNGRTPPCGKAAGPSGSAGQQLRAVSPASRESGRRGRRLVVTRSRRSGAGRNSAQSAHRRDGNPQPKE